MENSPLSQRFTARFVAGQRLEEGIRVLQSLQNERIDATLDEAARSRDNYLKAQAAIRESGLPATVSIKLTQFGLDFSEEACLNNVTQLVAFAKGTNSRVEIDMESSEYTDRTLRIVTSLHNRFGGHVRAVIQAYLFRSEDDIRSLSARGIPVRLCKGAYREPPSVAYPLKSDVDTNYVKLMKLLLDGGTDPAIASHDEAILKQARLYARERKVSPARFEFQMLYGIRRDLQNQLTGDGYRLRLYVPYGDAWYPYFMRRLAERPANVVFIAKNLLRN
jgi:proline dehydrogenase